MVLLKLNSQQYEEGTEKAKKKTKDLENLISGALTGALLAAGQAAVAFANESLAEFQQFEKGIKEVYTLLPNASKESLGAMKQDVIDFSVEVGRTTDETVPAMYQAISAGVPQENVFDFMKIASDAALGGVTSLEVAVDGITSVVNAYGEEAVDAQQASDLMFTAVKGGKTTFEELSSSLFNVIPTAAALKVEFGDITAALATMTSAGVPTSVATTQLRQLLVELSKAGSESAAMFEDLAGVGFREFIAQGGNLQEALQIMEAGAADLGIGINDLFGSVEAGSAALSLTGEGTAKFTQELEGAAEASDATSEAANTMADSMEYLESRANAVTEAYKIQMGEGISPLRAAFLELKIATMENAIENSKMESTAIAAREALIEQGLSASEAERALVALSAEGRVYSGTAEEAEAISRRAAIAQQLLAEGFQGSAKELGQQARLIDETEGGMRAYNEAAGEFYKAQAEAAAATSDVADAAIAEAEAIRAAAQARAEAAGINEEFADKEAQLAHHTGTAEQAVIAANLANEQYFEGLEEQKQMAEEAAQAQAELARAMGDTFTALSESTEPLGIFNESIADITAESGNLTVNSDSLNSALYAAADSAGANAGALALLKVATGELSEAQAEAIIKQVALEQTLQTLAEGYATGDLTLQEYMESAQNAVQDINNLNVQFDTMSGSVTTSKDEINNLVGVMGTIPSEIRTHISITSDPMPNMPTVGGGSGGSLPGAAGDAGVQTHARGGFTGWGAENEIAGMVHGQEFVFSAPAVRSIGLPMLEMLHQQGMAAGGNSGVSIGDVYVTPGGADTPIEYGRAVRRDLLTVARGKGLRR